MTDENGRRGRGTPRVSGEPRLLAETLDVVARRLRLPPARALGGVFGGWDALVGPSMAAHVRPRSLRDGVLTLGVDDPVWASQLRHLESDLLRRVREVAVDTPVERLRVVVEGGQASRRGRHR